MSLSRRVQPGNHRRRRHNGVVDVDKVLVPVRSQMAEHYRGRSTYLYYEVLYEQQHQQRTRRLLAKRVRQMGYAMVDLQTGEVVS